MRNKILAFILIVLMVQFLMPALALAEDLPVVDEPATTVITLQSEPVVTEPVVVTATPENSIDLTQPEPTVEVVESAPLVEAAPVVPYELPTNPLCEGITGDLNGDGLINKYDAEVMLQMAKGLEPRNACADLDLDGFISAGDISLLRKTYKIDLPAHPEIVAELAELQAEAEAERAADPSSYSCTLGDANGDNMIDYKDKGLVIQMMKSELPRTKAADLDGDGYIGPGDSSLLTSMIKFSHAASTAVTEEEKGNCDVPTALIQYSLDNGVTYVSEIKVKKDDILTIKAVFSKPLNEYEYAFLDIDNDLGADIFMKKSNDSESIYNLVINKSGNLKATVAVKAINGTFTDNISLTGGNSFLIENNNEVKSFGGITVGGSYSDCLVVNYGDWSDPVDGKSIREVISKVPYDCQLTIAQRKDLEKIVTAEAPVVEPAILEMPVVATQVLGEKIYADGSLLRAINDLKIFAIINGNKYHIKTVKELKTKFIGMNIIYDVDPKILELYPSMN